MGIVRQQSPNLFFEKRVDRFEAKSAEAFVQHIAIRLIPNGYVYFVLCEIPSNKDPRRIDDKFASRYGVGENKWALLRRAERGEAKVRYLRFGTTFLLIATPGAHVFFEEEKGAIRDARVEPIRCFGYTVRAKRGSKRSIPSVRLSFERLLSFRMNLLAMEHSTAEEIESFFRGQNFVWFSGVKRQVFRLLGHFNEMRRCSGLPPVFVSREAFANRSLDVFRVILT